MRDQIDMVDWYIVDDLSTFDLDLDHPVSGETAKEMTKIEMNSYCFHRKFDGKLDTIDFEFKQKDSDERKICKVFDLLGYGQIEDFVDQEDIDTEDLMSECSDEDSDDKKSGEDADISFGVHNVPSAVLQSSRPKWAKSKR